MSTTLAYVESPYQLQNAVQYSRLVDNGSLEIFIRDNGNPNQLQQFREVVDDLHLGCVRYVRIPKEGISKLPFMIGHLSLLLLRLLFSRRLVVGDLRSPVARMLLMFSRSENVTIVDDGLYLLDQLNLIRKRKYHVYTNLPALKILEARQTNLNVIVRDSAKVEVISDGNTMFIGMKLVEIGYISESCYLEVLANIIRLPRKADAVYYAHREEALDKIERIEAMGWQVQWSVLPLERLFARDGAPGGKFYTFYSTALYNLSRIIDGAKFCAIRPPETWWPSKARQSIGQCYALFDAAGIEIVPVKELR